jgi:hypothetical protein
MLTRQQQWLILAVVFLFLVGGVVKAWRSAHPQRASAAAAAVE